MLEGGDLLEQIAAGNINSIEQDVSIRRSSSAVPEVNSKLVKVKEPMPELKRKGVVYEVPCNDCDHVCIGETGRTLEKRLKEHRSAVKKNDRKNGIAVHAWDTGHQVKWESASVKEVETNLSNRRIMEALHIQRTPYTTNLDCGLNIDPVWFPLLP